MLYLAKNLRVMAVQRTSRFAVLLLMTMLALSALLQGIVASSAANVPAPTTIRTHKGPDDKALTMHSSGLVARRPIPVMLRREGRRLVWSDFLYPAKDPESPLNFELDPFNATAELTASQQDDIIYAAQHPTPKPTEKSTWKKFWEIFF